MKRIKNLLMKYYQDLDIDFVEESVKRIDRSLFLLGFSKYLRAKEIDFNIFYLMIMMTFFGTFIYIGQVSQWYHFYVSVVSSNKLEVFRAINVLASTFVPFSEFIFVWIQRKKLHKLISLSKEGIQDFIAGSSSGAVFRKTLMKGRIIKDVVFVCVIFTHLGYLSIPIILTIIKGKPHFPDIPGDIIGFMPRNVSPNSEISYALITIGTSFSGIIGYSFYILFITFLSHTLGQFHGIIRSLEILKEFLNTPKDKKDVVEQDIKTLGFVVDFDNQNQVVDELLRFCVKRHQFILKYHGVLADTYTIIFGFHFLFMSVVLISILQTMQSWGIMNAFISSSVSILPLLIYCFSGELILTANSRLTFAIYDAGWELMNPKQAKILLFMLKSAQRHVIFLAANLLVLNMDTFGNVMQLVYKVYAVFR